MDLVGVTIDVFISTGDSWSFWEALIGRPADLRPDRDTAEWKLAPRPEIALRVRIDQQRAGFGRVGLGVKDLQELAHELEPRVGQLSAIETKPGVLSALELHDPDRNIIVFWQDLLRA